MESWKECVIFSDKVPEGFSRRSVKQQEKYLNNGKSPKWFDPSGEISQLLEMEYNAVPKWYIKINKKSLNENTIKALYGVWVTFLKSKWKSRVITTRKSITPSKGKYEGKKLQVIGSAWQYDLYQDISWDKVEEEHVKELPIRLDKYSEYLREY